MCHRPALFCAIALVSCREAPVGHHLAGPLATWDPLPPCTEEDSPQRVRCPPEFRGVLDNPHLGFTSFHTVASELAFDKHPRARVAYARFWWNELEPNRGEIDFGAIDRALEAARADGQTFAFRVMPEESAMNARRVPGWLADDAGGTWGIHDGIRYFSPDYNSPRFLEAVEATTAALGARYDGNPALEHVDVGFVGDSGEWAYVVGGASMPNDDSARRIIDAVTHAFPTTPVLMLVGAPDDGARPLQHAVSEGSGWRADCWGDIRRGWNHHDSFYEQRLDDAQARDAWRTAPVAVETCGDMEAWKMLRYDISQVRWLLRWALDHHVSLINNKSRSVPTEWRELVDEYLAHAGYRFTVWRVRHPNVGTRIDVTVSLFNRGTAPNYRPYRLAVRARASGDVVATAHAAQVLDLVQPGPLEVSATLDLPAAVVDAELDVAVVGADGMPAVHLANDGERPDGWLPVSSVGP